MIPLSMNPASTAASVEFADADATADQPVTEQPAPICPLCAVVRNASLYWTLQELLQGWRSAVSVSLDDSRCLELSLIGYRPNWHMSPRPIAPCTHNDLSVCHRRPCRPTRPTRRTQHCALTKQAAPLRSVTSSRTPVPRQKRAWLVPVGPVYSCSPRVLHHADTEVRGVLLDARTPAVLARRRVRAACVLEGAEQKFCAPGSDRHGRLGQRTHGRLAKVSPRLMCRRRGRRRQDRRPATQPRGPSQVTRAGSAGMAWMRVRPLSGQFSPGSMLMRAGARCPAPSPRRPGAVAGKATRIVASGRAVLTPGRGTWAYLARFGVPRAAADRCLGWR